MGEFSLGALRLKINELAGSGSHPTLAKLLADGDHGRIKDYMNRPDPAVTRSLILKGTKVRRWLAENGRGAKLALAWDNRGAGTDAARSAASASRELERMLLDAVAGELDVEGAEAKAILDLIPAAVLSDTDKTALRALADVVGASLAFREWGRDVTGEEVSAALNGGA